jgi:hypothetical protein
MKEIFSFLNQVMGIYHGLLFTDSISSRYGFTPYEAYIKMISADTIVLTHYDDAEWENYIFLLTPGNGKLSKLQITDELCIRASLLVRRRYN